MSEISQLPGVGDKHILMEIQILGFLSRKLLFPLLSLVDLSLGGSLFLNRV